jgi:ribosomal protein S18 acetylase RimI-like enzyme
MRTHLMVHRLGGSTVEQRDDVLVVRTPHNPSYYWGNFILAPRAPGAGDAARWLHLFTDEFPDAKHVAIGVDGTAGELGEATVWREAGLDVEVDSVLTADDVSAPARRDDGATFAALSPDDDAAWAQLVDVRLALDEAADDAHRVFVERRIAESRAHIADGHGVFVAASVDGVVRASLGIVTDGSGLGRYQTVETHPDFRRRGFAATLLQLAADVARRDFGVRRFVIVADPDYVAIDLYRRAGFIDAEREVKWERAPE